MSNDAARPASPDGSNITTDSLTDLDWLDPTATMGISFNSMTALLTTPAYTGFRHASIAELGEFFEHLGLPTGGFPLLSGTPDGGASYSAAAAYFGSTFPNVNYSRHRRP
jgi:hypothetical protein